MKKIMFPSIILILSLIFGCQNNIENNPISSNGLSKALQQKAKAFDALYSRHFVYMLNNIEDTRVNNESIVFDENKLQDLSTSFFQKSGVDMEKLKATSQARISDDYQVFSQGQINLFSELQNDLGTINGPTDAMNVAVAFRDKIGISNLNDEEKTQMLAMTEYVYITGKYFSENLEYIEDYGSDPEENNFLQKSSRVSGCTVDWRGAFINGVVGGFAGGIAGGYTGAAGGTVALPGFGTVTGAVAGAVFGFAGGFTAGVMKKIMTELIRTCARHYAIKVITRDGQPANTLPFCFQTELVWNETTGQYDAIPINCPPIYEIKIQLKKIRRLGNYF